MAKILANKKTDVKDALVKIENIENLIKFRSFQKCSRNRKKAMAETF